MSLTWGKSLKAEEKVRNFKEKAENEAGMIENSNSEQLKFIEEDIFSFGCICFIDYWLGQGSALLDTTYSNGVLDFMIIRMAYNRGCCALALRQLGTLLRSKREQEAGGMLDI
jgi:hypothetical protein